MSQLIGKDFETQSAAQEIVKQGDYLCKYTFCILISLDHYAVPKGSLSVD